MVTKLRFMKLGNCFSNFVNQNPRFPELFLRLENAGAELASFSLARQWVGAEPELAKLERPGSSWSRDRVAWTSLVIMCLTTFVFMSRLKSDCLSCMHAVICQMLMLILGTCLATFFSCLGCKLIDYR